MITFINENLIIFGVGC